MSASPIRIHNPKTKVLLFVRHIPWNECQDEPLSTVENFIGLSVQSLCATIGVQQTVFSRPCLLSSTKGRARVTATEFLTRIGSVAKLPTMKLVRELTEGSIELGDNLAKAKQLAEDIMKKHIGNSCEVQIFFTHLPHASLLPRQFVGPEGFTGLEAIELEKGGILWLNIDERTCGAIQPPKAK